MTYHIAKKIVFEERDSVESDRRRKAAQIVRTVRRRNQRHAAERYDRNGPHY